MITVDEVSHQRLSSEGHWRERSHVQGPSREGGTCALRLKVIWGASPEVLKPNEDSTVFSVLSSSTGERRLEVEPELRRQCSRGYVVRATEGGKEVVKCILVSDIDCRQCETPSVTFAFE
jgi:hypothetical protein